MRKRVKEKGHDTRSALSAVSSAFKAFRPAREVLKRVRAVPTRFAQLDHAVRVGGFPIERFSLVHGPSNEGKTMFMIGLMDSFLTRDHFVLFVDAERTTPVQWAESLMGSMVDHPGFFADRPVSYEDTIANVRNFLNTVAELRAKNKVHEDTSALVVVDSLRKLVPSDLMKEILKSEADGANIKGGRDRGAQLKAKMNSAWCDELVPLLEHANAGFIAVAREMQDPDADMWAKKFGNDYKVGGGSSIYYDASLVMRIERAKWITDGEGRDRLTYGEQHRITIKKTKVAGKDDKTAVCFFHSSNGVLIPAGFDRARDVLDLAERFGIVEKRGSVYSYNGEKISSGQHNVVKILSASPEHLAMIEKDVRAKFEETPPVEITEDGEVL